MVVYRKDVSNVRCKDTAARYKLFVLDGLVERIREFYVNNCVTGIFGDRAYRESI